MAADPELLRAVSAVCHRLPVLETSAFKEEALQEETDALLLGYLSTLTKAHDQLNEVRPRDTLPSVGRSGGVGLGADGVGGRRRRACVCVCFCVWPAGVGDSLRTSFCRRRTAQAEGRDRRSECEALLYKQRALYKKSCDRPES